MPLILAFGRQRQVDLCEFEASLVYRVSARNIYLSSRFCERTQRTGTRGTGECIWSKDVLYLNQKAIKKPTALYNEYTLIIVFNSLDYTLGIFSLKMYNYNCLSSDC